MNVQDTIKKRKAIKLYKPGPTPSDEDIALITEAAYLAPTPSDVQDSKVLVFTKQEDRDELSKYFADNNIENVKGAQAVFIMVGKPWVRDQKIGEEYFYEVSTKYYDVPEEVKRGIAAGTAEYYNKYSPFTDQLSTYSSAIQFSFMVLQATDLGYASTPMLGIYRDKLTDFLKSKKLISDDEIVNMTMSIGIEDVDNPVNKQLKRIRIPKDQMIKIIK